TTDADTAYLTALYRDVLGRSPDDGGLAAWRVALNTGVSRFDVARRFWESPEHRGQQVDQYFATFLSRAADAGGRAFWINSFLGGASEFDVQRGFLTSDEFLRQFPSSLDYVGELYALILGRDVDSTGLAAWSSLVEQPTGRDAVAGGILLSVEAE